LTRVSSASRVPCPPAKIATFMPIHRAKDWLDELDAIASIRLFAGISTHKAGAQLRAHGEN
jgi:hypothetical protein